MILPRFPFPLEKGDKLRAFHHIKTLSKQHDVYLFCIASQKPTDEALQALSPYCQEIRWFQPTKISVLWNIFRLMFCKKPWQNAFFVFGNAKKKLQNFIADVSPDHLFFQLVRMSDYADVNTKIPTTLDYQDAFSLGMLRRAKQAKFPKNIVFKSEHRRLKTAETKAFDKFDFKMIISEADRESIHHPKRDEILIVKNGIDTDFFKPNPNVPKTADLLFVGNLSYPPNVQAVQFLLEKIMPKLHAKNPDLKLLIAGANPAKKWFRYESKNIQILANLNDIRDAYWRAKIFVAPLFSGTGLQNKVLEAMATKLPCIVTPIANSGLQATTNNELLIAEAADEFVEQILHLHNNPSVCEQFSERAFTFATQRFSWENELEKWQSKTSKIPVK